MKNLILALMFFGGIFYFWNGEGPDREAASIPQAAELQNFTKTASIGWVDSAPKARPFVATEQQAEAAVQDGPRVDYSGLTPLEAAQAYLEANRAAWNIQGHHDMRHSVTQTPMGASVKFEFSQDGIPITGMYINIDLGKNNEVKAVENLYRPMEAADMKANLLSPEDVHERLSQRFQSERGGDAHVLLFAGTHNLKPEPVYSMSAVEVANDGQTRRPVKLLVRAVDGQVIDVTYERAEIQN